MNNWINDFLFRCLEGIPEGSYRTWTEKELEDHLLALCRDLEEAGYPPPEARALAAAHMGDPAELARRYIREWRRTLWQWWLTAAELLSVDLGIAAAGELYIATARGPASNRPPARLELCFCCQCLHGRGDDQLLLCGGPSEGRGHRLHRYRRRRLHRRPCGCLLR